jgi:hypothetical protein
LWQQLFSVIEWLPFCRPSSVQAGRHAPLWFTRGHKGLLVIIIVIGIEVVILMSTGQPDLITIITSIGLVIATVILALATAILAMFTAAPFLSKREKDIMIV